MRLTPIPRTEPIRGRVVVPASKSLHQRALLLRALAEGPCAIEAPGGQPGDDVRRLRDAMDLVGRWEDGAWGRSRDRLVLDLGLGATGFRFAAAAATLRPPRSRTLVTGRPPLLARPHAPLRRALARLGGHVRRRPSGAFRVVAGGVRGGHLELEADRSSQFASALMLVAPRIGGLSLRLLHRPVSRPYLALTGSVLRAFGIRATTEGLDAPGGRIEVPAGTPACDRYVVEGDASSAAAWWAAAALTGGSIEVVGVPVDTAQADGHLLGVLARMGARIEAGADGAARVVGPSPPLRAPGAVDLSDAPDLLPTVGALAAVAEGETRIHGVAHARFKESDRRETTAAAIHALGGRAEVTSDGLRVVGGRLPGGTVDAAGDHRIVLAFGVLGLKVPGIVVRGAEAVDKSWPGFARDFGHEVG